MIFEYALGKNDYVKMLLVSTQNNQRPRSKIFAYFTPFSLIVLSIPSFLTNDKTLGYFFLGIGLFFLVFNSYLKKRVLAKQYEKLVEITFEQVFNTPIKVSYDGFFIHEETTISQTKYQLKGLKRINEYKNYLFIYFHNGHALVFPKDQLNDFELNAFVDQLKNKTDVRLVQELQKTI